MNSNGAPPILTGELLARGKLLLDLVVFTWLVFFLTVLAPGLKTALSLVPRTLRGFFAIPTSVFIHSDGDHLVGNTEFFLLFGWLVLLRGRSDFIAVSLIILLCAGLGTWLVGRHGRHMGASGIILGYVGFLLFRGYVEHDPLSALLTIFLGVMYAESLSHWLIPDSEIISWEGHLFGFLGGVLAAYYLDGIKVALAHTPLWHPWLMGR